MHLHNLVAVTSFAIAIPLTAICAQSTAANPGNWSFSLGVDPSNLDLHTPEGGTQARLVANLTRSWQSANSKFGRHISLMVGADAPRDVQGGFGLQCAGDCLVHFTRKYAGVTAGASYDLFRISRFTPYLTGGAGIYYSGFKRGPADGMLTPSELLIYKYGGFSQNKVSFGANAGLGLRARIGSHELFIEQALHEFDLRHQGMGVYPLSIGFRF